MNPRVSVIVCTHDRAGHLGDILHSLLAQIVDPSLRWELIVVDNASHDDTKSVVEAQIASAGVEIRYIAEPELGLSVARNRGWREARGEIVAYLDDDVVADPHWLHELLRAYDAPEVAGAGGKLLPLLVDGERHPVDPAWLSAYCFDLGDRERSVTVLSGSNMSFRRTRVEQVGGFDRHLGRAGSCMLAGDENDVFDAILRHAHGSHLAYVPRAIIRHKIIGAQVTDDSLILRGYCGGISNVRIDRKASPAQRARRRLRRLVAFATWGLRILARRIRGTPADLRERARMQEFAGYYRELVHGPLRACRDCPMFPLRATRLPPSR